MRIKFLISVFFIIFLMGCYPKEIESLNFSDSAKQELRQQLQKSVTFDTFDITYNFYTSIANQKLVDITFHNIKQGKNQREEIDGNMLGFNLSTYSVTSDEKQVTCALFNNSWKCSYGDKVCIEKGKGEICQSVSQEGIPPTIKPEMLAKAKVAKTEAKQILDMQVQCYKLLTTESGNQAVTEVCLNQDGVIMSIAINAKLFQAIMEAKSFSKIVNLDSFAMPAITG